MVSLDFQFQAFCITIAAGAAVGILFDVYRVFRGFTGPGRFFTCLGDLLFWAAAASVVFTFLIYGNWGEVRLYVFIGLAVGAGLYFRWCSRPLLRLLVGLTRLLRFIIRKTTYYFLVVVLLPCLIVRRIAGWLFAILAFPFLPVARRLAPARSSLTALLAVARQKIQVALKRINKKP